MSHLTERTILELRDGVPVDADASAHLDECAVCRTALEEAEARSVDIASALTDLDEGFDVASAREAVAARLAGRATTAGGGRRPSARAPFWTLGRAATFLRKIGIEIDYTKEGRARTRIIHITATDTSSVPDYSGAQPSLPSASSAGISNGN